MKQAIGFLAVSAAALALAGCGKASDANEQAQPDNVELPAEEAVGGVDASAAPMGEASDAAAASDAADSGAAPSDDASASKSPRVSKSQ